MLAFACLIGLASIANVEMLKTVRVSSVFEDHLVTQDIIDDPERNTVLTVVGQVDNFKELKSSVNLHDFNAGYVALKDITGKTCLLKPLYDSKREHIPGLNSVSGRPGEKFVSWQKIMYWYRHPKELTYEEVRTQAGEEVADFCHDYVTYNLIPRSPQNALLAGKYSGGRVKRCMFFCSLCFNEVDGYQEDVIDSDYKGN